ncbi:hypothetical protein D9756_005575 [Leucocoprinus leucothites]|uniref:MYND-type domain-containing protein n=1 Tax=Leucocoprinus leucothites TaxID=201217 RepID=A0A8H5G015_9AGAR|nr:hypothetical protein D9756_005575 [Leucoagaricus leucothites]
MENFKLTRDAILNVLNEISINIPRHTKLKTDRLRHRLERCLDAAQRYGNLFGDENTIIDPSTYPPWTHSQGTVEKDLDRKIWGGIDLGISPGAFSNMCGLVVTLGEQWDRGIREVVLTDQESSAIAVKIHDVYCVEEGRPLLTIGFATIAGTRKMGIKRAIKSFYAAAKQSEAVMIYASPEEQALLFRLFKQNQSHLSPEFAQGISDDRCTASFLLPTSWLAMEDLSRLGKTTGCVACGDPTRYQCERCQSVQYCGKDCQRNHWVDHQHVCRAISSGTWHTVTLDPSPGGKMHSFKYMATINRYDDLGDKPNIDKLHATDQPPPNTYGDKYYLVKLQMPLLGPSTQILTYDKRKSFQLFIRQDLNPDTFSDAAHALGDYPKIYRWAQRVGDWEWKICFDQEPGIVSQW